MHTWCSTQTAGPTQDGAPRQFKQRSGPKEIKKASVKSPSAHVATRPSSSMEHSGMLPGLCMQEPAAAGILVHAFRSGF